MEGKNVWLTLLTGLAVLLAGAWFIRYNPWLGYTDSALLYLAAVAGGGCFWIGSSLKK